MLGWLNFFISSASSINFFTTSGSELDRVFTATGILSVKPAIACRSGESCKVSLDLGQAWKSSTLHVIFAEISPIGFTCAWYGLVSCPAFYHVKRWTGHESKATNESYWYSIISASTLTKWKPSNVHLYLCFHQQHFSKLSFSQFTQVDQISPRVLPFLFRRCSITDLIQFHQVGVILL